MIRDVNLKFYQKLLCMGRRAACSANFDFKILTFLGFEILKFAAAVDLYGASARAAR